jgi:hypothetical protein
MTRDKTIEKVARWQPIATCPGSVRRCVLNTFDGITLGFREKDTWYRESGEPINFITDWYPIPARPSHE